VDLEWWSTIVERRSAVWVALVASGAGGVALAWHTFSAAGSDDSGYLSQALLWSRAWRDGLDGYRDVLHELPGWPLAAGATAALGWRPGLAQHWQVPTYPPGLPLLMAAPLSWGGIPMASLVVVASAGLSVWAAGSLARSMSGQPAGIVTAILLAASPIFLFQSSQPMSDVPVTAAWMLCWWSVFNSRPLAAGLLAAIALLIRPNLAPAALVPLIALLRRRLPGERSRGRVVRAVVFALPVLAAALFVAWVQWRWYGSPLVSGYGTARDLFAWENVPINATRYARWLWESQPVLMVAPLALAVGGPACGARPGWDLLVFAAAVVLAYLAYAVFEDWSYLRFLLPALAAMAVLTGVVAGRLVSAAGARWRGLALTACAIVVAVHGIAVARSRGAFSLADDHARARLAGAYLGAAVPSDTVLIAAQQSGSMRLMTGHPIVRWDLVSGEELDAAVTMMTALDREVWWVLDEAETALVRARFPSQASAALDWPPRMDAGTSARTMAWRIGDRAGFFGGVRIPTDRLR
jgi:hypothetical protein